MFNRIVGHTSFLGHTGYAHHAREFFTELNKRIPTRVRNFAHINNIDYLTQEQKDMVIHQTWSEPPWEVGTPYIENSSEKIVDIILDETNHHFFYDKYKWPKIAYNVWESTLQPDHFFKKLLEFDQLWVPTTWQAQCSINQGFPADRVKIIPEGINVNKFCPGDSLIPDKYVSDRFRFILIGRWDARKSTTQIIRAFLTEFKSNEPIDLFIHVDNPFGHTMDGMNSTEERLEKYGFTDERIKILRGLEKVENDDLYLAYLRNCHCFLSCAMSEGWNIPLIQAIAVGVPTVSSNYGAQLDFAGEVSNLVNIKRHVKPGKLFMQSNSPGTIAEPDFEHLQQVMRDVYNNYEERKQKALIGSEIIREKFTWKNAVDKAIYALEELYDKKYPFDKLVRVNLGSGDRKKDGYINVDKYDESADQQMDLMDLKFENESIDELNSSHSLEHFDKFELEKVLNECYRVLKFGGIFNIEVPNFEYVIKNWISKDEQDRWGFAEDMIFGLRTNPGQIHKIGFTKDRLTDLLNKHGFEIEKSDIIWSHDQESISIKAIKKDILLESAIILDCYPNSERKLELLINQINKLKKYNMPIIIVTHYKDIPKTIYDMVDYILFDKDNIFIDFQLNYWYTFPKNVKLIFKTGIGHHAVAVHSSIKNGLEFCQNKFKYVHFIEYDAGIDFDQYFNKVQTLLHNKKFVGFLYDEEQNKDMNSGLEPTYGVMPNIFSTHTNWFNTLFPDIRDGKSYEEIGQLCAKNIGRRFDYIYENWLHIYFSAKNMMQDSYLFSKDEKKQLIDNVINPEVTGGIVKYAYISETDEHQIILFILNVKEGIKNYTVSLDDKIIESKTITPGNLHYYVFDKGKTITVVIDDQTEIFEIDPTKVYDEVQFKFYDDKVKCFTWNSVNSIGFVDVQTKINYHFIDGAFVEVKGDGSGDDKRFDVSFIDKSKKETIYSAKLGFNSWAKTSKKYFVDYKLMVKEGDKILLDHDIDFTDKKVLISMESKSMGDTIAWFPYVQEFKDKYKCDISVSTFWNKIFKDNYPELNFVEPGSKVEGIYAGYYVGVFDNDYERNKVHWRSLPLQKVATDILGLEYKEIRPRLVSKINKPIIDGDYVCISQHSTFQCKYWMYPHGWQTIVDYLSVRGYKVAVVSLKPPIGLSNIIDQTSNDKDIFETINVIQNSKLFIGISSGPSWLAWALNVPTVLISGYSSEWAEMQDCERIINKNVCNSCWQDVGLPIDRGDWNWCPRKKDFECTKNITPEMVIKGINKYI